MFLIKVCLQRLFAASLHVENLGTRTQLKYVPYTTFCESCKNCNTVIKPQRKTTKTESLETTVGVQHW